jgi:hypothetical protein
MGVSQFIYDEKCFYQEKKMVEQASAQRCAGINYSTFEDCDHFTVCKPIDKSDPRYFMLVRFIRICQREVSRIHSMNPFVAFLLITNSGDMFDILG